MKTIITFGTFDVFHVGHLNILQRAKQLGGQLVVGVSSDALNIAKKGRTPVYSQSDRMGIVAGLKCVDRVFLEESLELKADYIRQFNADMLVMGMTGPAALIASRIFVTSFISLGHRPFRPPRLLRWSRHISRTYVPRHYSAMEYNGFLFIHYACKPSDKALKYALLSFRIWKKVYRGIC